MARRKPDKAVEGERPITADFSAKMLETYAGMILDLADHGAAPGKTGRVLSAGVSSAELFGFSRNGIRLTLISVCRTTLPVVVSNAAPAENGLRVETPTRRDCYALVTGRCV